MVRVHTERLRDLSQSLSMEWFETNGLGGYAMGTVSGARTRRYHGLLCAALRPPVDRWMLLSDLEEQLRIDGQVVDLSCNIYADVVHPQGHMLLTEFRLDPWPVWTLEAGPVVIEKSVLMPHEHNAVVVSYRCLKAASPVTLIVRPLMAWREHHHLRRASVEFGLQVEQLPGCVRLVPQEGPAVALQMGQGSLWPATEWYYSLNYPREAQRGLDHVEDLYSPGAIEWSLRAGQQEALVACLEEPLQTGVDALCEAERARRLAVKSAAPRGDEVARVLLGAADQFIVLRRSQRTEAKSIIAGYPWFTDWGRDTMIALPGLLLATGRHDEAKQVIQAYTDQMRDGLIPNMFPDESTQAACNTVDATLWLFAAVRRYYDATGDLQLLRDGLLQRLEESIAAHRQGTLFGIRMDDDGLLTAGDETTQLTWMDAKVGDWVVTPRHGKAVEINALWYSALRTVQFFAHKLDRDQKDYGSVARMVKDAFSSTFYSDELGYCYDCVRDDYRDGSLRPNQVIALSLPYSVLSVAQERAVLRAVTEKLLTPYGLRTLAPDDEHYRGHYEGDQWARDGAYHQGTVWPWLLGPFLNASMVHAASTETGRRRVRELILPLVEHLSQGGLGSISEIFDGDPPHAPRGCPAQAWSVAALLGVWLQHGLGEP